MKIVSPLSKDDYQFKILYYTIMTPHIQSISIISAMRVSQTGKTRELCLVLKTKDTL